MRHSRHIPPFASLEDSGGVPRYVGRPTTQAIRWISWRRGGFAWREAGMRRRATDMRKWAITIAVLVCLIWTAVSSIAEGERSPYFTGYAELENAYGAYGDGFGVHQKI